jgi:hypothetical protein
MKRLLLTNRTPATASKITGGTYWRFSWTDLDTGATYETTVDTTMRNFPAWQSLITAPNPYGVYTGLDSVRRNTRHHRAVVTADAVPELTDQLASQHEAGVLHRAVINNQRSQGSTFHNLFDLE